MIFLPPLCRDVYSQIGNLESFLLGSKVHCQLNSKVRLKPHEPASWLGAERQDLADMCFMYFGDKHKVFVLCRAWDKLYFCCDVLWHCYRHWCRSLWTLVHVFDDMWFSFAWKESHSIHYCKPELTMWSLDRTQRRHNYRRTVWKSCKSTNARRWREKYPLWREGGNQLLPFHWP